MFTLLSFIFYLTFMFINGDVLVPNSTISSSVIDCKYLFVTVIVLYPKSRDTLYISQPFLNCF